MMCYFKINHLLIGAEIRKLIDFIGLHNEGSGEVLTDKKISAYLKNLIFTLTPGCRDAKVGGSIHVFANGGELNNDRFTFDKFLRAVDELSRFISSDDIVNVLEFGVNVITPFDPTDFVKNLLSHQKTSFNRTMNPGMAYAEVRHTHYVIKIYNKGLQQPTGSYVLRYEVKFFRMQKLFSDGLKWSQLGNLETWEYLGKVLTDKFSDVIYFDPSINLDQVPEKDRKIIERGYNPIYWQNLSNSHAYRDRKKFQNLIRKHGTKFNSLSELIEDEVSVLLKSYHYSEGANSESEMSKLVKSYHYSQLEELTQKETSFDPLVNCYPLLSCTNSPTHIITTDKRFCQVTGLTFHNQRPGLKNFSPDSVRWYYENEPETYEKQLKPLLTDKWDNESFEVQCEAICHSFRNKESNPRNNLKRDLKNLERKGLKLFPTMDLLPPEKLRLLKNEPITA